MNQGYLELSPNVLASDRLVANKAQVDGILLCGWNSRTYGALHTEQASLREEMPAQGPPFSLGGRTNDLRKSGLPKDNAEIRVTTFNLQSAICR
ncbi:unnamed protein product [Ilex paraguariensis]|uniref:Uncharacterized protein n=1 Tax=Ilex paraguariensis TaxID=185542 RepID=A0ABC8R2J8_9AQUA